jgi:hypothetical protein
MRSHSRILALAAAVLLLTLAATAQEASLGELARQQRQQKKPGRALKVFTNDDLGTAATPPPDKHEEAANPPEKAKAANADGGAEQQESGEDAEKARSKEFRKRIEAQKKAIASLEHEIDLIQREMNVDSAVYYADAGTRLRDDKQWTEKRMKALDEIESKKKELATAKDKLDEIREEGRKAGVPQAELE